MDAQNRNLYFIARDANGREYVLSARCGPGTGSELGRDIPTILTQHGEPVLPMADGSYALRADGARLYAVREAYCADRLRALLSLAVADAA